MVPRIAVGVVKEEVSEKGALDEDGAVVGVAPKSVLSIVFNNRQNTFDGRQWVVYWCTRIGRDAKGL